MEHREFKIAQKIAYRVHLKPALTYNVEKWTL
jgi:hypothetical protein